MMMLVNQEVRKSKKGKTCQLFSLWKLTHYLFLFYEGNEDEIEDMDDEELDEDEIQSTGGQRSDDDASKSGGKKKYIHKCYNHKWTGRHYHMKKFLRTFRTWPRHAQSIFLVYSSR